MKFKKIFLVIILSIALAVGTYAVSIITIYDGNKNQQRIQDFYTIPENTLDVVFVGSSSVHTCFYPTLAWKHYGFTSYCLGMDRCSYVTILPMVKEAIRTQHPKLIVIDIDEFTLSENYMDNEHPILYWYDSVPHNNTKLDFVKEAIPAKSRPYYYLPFIRTHSKISDNNQIKESISLFKRYKLDNDPSVYLKGAELSNIIEQDVQYLIDYNKITERKKINKTAEKYLNQLIDYCKDCDTPILFIDYPKGRIANDTEYYEKVYYIPEIQRIIENNGLFFLNYNTLNNPAKITIYDFFKPDAHLNVYGCEKFTTYFSDYIVNNYDIISSHSEETVKQWNSDSDFADSIINNLKNNKKDFVINESNISDIMQ
ncbi:MAG: hypothetical protein MJ168_01045 [Clostridia bacterium]|nr:hypothetical protein [Clostridia bacterium]